MRSVKDPKEKALLDTFLNEELDRYFSLAYCYEVNIYRSVIVGIVVLVVYFHFNY